jgi:CRP-like cAMP-binding protein
MNLYNEDASLREKVAELLSLQLFSKDVTDTIYANTDIVNFKSGDVISREGETTSKLYFLVSGAVKTVCGDREVMRLRRHGDIIGILPFVDEKPQPFTVTALEPTECLAMETSLLNALDINKHMDFHYIIHRILTETLTEHMRMVLLQIR